MSGGGVYINNKGVKQLDASLKCAVEMGALDGLDVSQAYMYTKIDVQ